VLEGLKTRELSAVYYLIQHQGEPTIGGGLSVATCTGSGFLEWPFVVVDGRTFLRGFDVTAIVPPSTGATPADGRIHLEYEEEWHSFADLEGSGLPQRQDDGFLGLSLYLDEWVKPAEVFEWKVDSPALAGPPDLALAHSVVVIVRPNELHAAPWARQQPASQPPTDPAGRAACSPAEGTGPEPLPTLHMLLPNSPLCMLSSRPKMATAQRVIARPKPGNGHNGAEPASSECLKRAAVSSCVQLGTVIFQP